MKKKFLLGGVLVMGAIIYAACGEQQAQQPLADAAISKDSLVKRGEYLVNVMGCGDCHSPKMMGPQGPMIDPERVLSGHPANLPLPKVNPAELQNWVLFNHSQTAFVGPWGASFAANITGDSTGIGSWTEEQFFRAMKEGKYKGLATSRPLLPPMPWQNFVNASDLDLKSMYLYLKSTKPVNNVVPTAIPPTELGK
ncbi:MAG: diheme cytochrome c-553 [Pseudobacter sp.]|uniref:diheme cytochrome c-553 n=1 Tax=Pseudobacter sp. TaxID=2045420 RepID=UPI003F7ED75C